jgi:hypothetical protein
MLLKQWLRSRHPAVSAEEKWGFFIFHVEFPHGPAKPVVAIERQPD